MRTRALLNAAACFCLTASMFSCGNEFESASAPLSSAVASGNKTLIVDDGQDGFEMLPPDEYHHFPRETKVWESWAGDDAEGGSYLRAPCGDNRGVGSVLTWTFDLPQGEHDFEVKLPSNNDERSNVVYCVLWDSPKPDSDCFQVDQNQKGWVSLGRHASGGRVQVVVDPLVCTSYYSDTAYVVADAVRVTPDPTTSSVPRDAQ